MTDPVVQVEVIIPTQTRYLALLGSIGEHIAQHVDGFSGDREALAYHLNLVLTEAASNAIKHATPSAKERVKICILLHDKELNIKVYDQGQGFDLAAIPTPDLEHPQENGMGLYFIRTLMDVVTYSPYGEVGNVLEMIKYW